ncbi:hypothetical protein OIO90_004651 [Microbotryomycetes sp. JL221]|nr:hypothetical protein OIO90_004651 [Microbotryomycetes sp. JL221]
MAPSPSEPPLSFISSIYKKAVEDDNVLDMTIKDVRQRLEEDHGWTCTKQEWKTEWRDLVKNRWVEIADAPSSQEQTQRDEKRSKYNKDGTKRKTKYEIMAAKNVATVMGAFLEDLTGNLLSAGSGDDDDQENEVEIESASEAARSGDSASRPVSPDVNDAPRKAKSKKPQPKRESSTKDKEPKRRKSNSKQLSDFKSAEMIIDSDDEGNSGAHPQAGPSNAKKRKQARTSDEHADDTDDSEVKILKPKAKRSKKVPKDNGKDRGRAKDRKTKTEKAPPRMKEGDAPRGTDAEEERVQKLKTLVAAAGVTRAFNNSTGAERKLTIERRLDHLESLLVEAGVFQKGGRLPSIETCKKVGEKRALSKEMQELGGVPETSGLRDGKKLSADSQHHVDKPKFGAFLSAIQDSEDSD